MRRLYSALKYVCIVALVISLIALVAVVAYVLINGVDKLSLDLLFGDYKDTPSILPAFIGTLQLVGIAAIIAVPIGVASAINDIMSATIQIYLSAEYSFLIPLHLVFPFYRYCLS